MNFSQKKKKKAYSLAAYKKKLDQLMNKKKYAKRAKEAEAKRGKDKKSRQQFEKIDDDIKFVSDNFFSAQVSNVLLNQPNSEEYNKNKSTHVQVSRKNRR